MAGRPGRRPADLGPTCHLVPRSLTAPLEEAEQERSEARVALERALEQQREAEQRASQLAELATLAIPLLGEHCPIWGSDHKSAWDNAKR